MATRPNKSAGREKVTGIGGVFFKARKPVKLAAWYHQKHLGVPVVDGNAEFAWREKSRPKKVGRTVWSIFPADSKYFAGDTMLNYRVANLDRMLAQLKRGGVKVEKVEDYDYGRFAWLIDPEGNRVELWEPKDA